MSSTYLIIAHGSRLPESNEAFHRLLADFREQHPAKKIFGCFLEQVEPTIPEGIENCIQSGAKEITVLPLMFFPGRHVRENIPRFLEEAKKKHPEVTFHYSGPLADHPMLLDLLTSMIERDFRNKAEPK